jgi:hypothetical protein
MQRKRPFEVSMEMYKESTKRIDSLEEKGFKLLTYISAVSAILIYFLSKEITGFYKFFVVTSLLFLIIAIIISLRCISIKYQKVLFIDALFNFEPDAEPVTKDKKAVVAEILNCTVYNQTVADNTADILKGARIMLSYGIFTTVISCVFFLYTPFVNDKSKVYQTEMTSADTVFKNSLISPAKNGDTSIKFLNNEIKRLNNRLDSIHNFFQYNTIKGKMQKPVVH